MLWLRGNHTAYYRGCIKWNEAKAARAKQAPERVRKRAATEKSAAPKAQRVWPSPEQMERGDGWNHVVRGGYVFKATTTPTPYPNQNPVLNRSRRRPGSLR